MNSTMEKLSMCRVCLSTVTPLCSIVNTNLHEIYEVLTKMPFVTEDSSPIWVCDLCCACLEDSYELRRRCLRSEELFTQLLRSNVQVNLQIMPDRHLSLGDEIQMIPIEWDNGKVKREDPEESQDDNTSPASEDVTATCSFIKVEIQTDNEMPDIAVEQNDADLYHSALGLHTECDIPLDIVKEAPDDVDTGTPRLAAQTYRKDTLLNSLQKTDQTMFKVEEPRRKTNTDIAVKSIKKHEIVETRDNTDIKVYNNKQNNSASDQNDAHKEMSDSIISADQSSNSKSSKKLKRFLCDTCQKCFNRKDCLKVHIRIHTGEKPYVCNVCKKCFTKKTNLDKHTRIHTGEKPYECAVCKKCFVEKGNLEKHTRIHTGEKAYECAVCKKCFVEKGNLEKHTRIHTGEKAYECAVCKKCYTKKTNLDKHTRIHTGEKPYECAVCKKCFVEKGNLEKHTLIHTSEKPYVCNVCKKCFAVKIHLEKHTRIHTSEKPYVCNVCKKSFAQKGNLEKHTRIHTGEKPCV